MARPMASSALPFEVVRLSRKPSPASRSASTAWSICSAGSGGSQVPNARMRCGESCASSSEVSPLICGRLSPAAHEIRICGSANNSARNRSACTCRSCDVGAQPRLVPRRADPRAHQQDRGDYRKAEQRQRGGQDHELLAIELEPGRNRLREVRVRLHGPRAGASTIVPAAIRPLRANEVHDSRVRRIATITPDMVCPKPHDFTLGNQSAVRESNDNIPIGSRG